MSLKYSLTKLCDSEDGNPVKIAAQGGLMAPTIRYHKGTFYIVCTNVSHKGHLSFKDDEHAAFILCTTDIWADEWSDPVYYDFPGIDTSLFWDDDDRVYLIGAADEAPETRIHQFEIDVKTGKKLSERKMLWEGITKVFPEGPHMYKKDGWYYLLIAEGGCFEDHHCNIARSRSVWGPFELNPANPVLGKTDPKGYIQYTGHGDLFQDPAGQWYFVCLGVRKNNGRFIMGRESVLTTATWPEGEFPVIDPAQVEVSLAIQHQNGMSPEWPIKRKPGRPDVAFVHIRVPVEENYEFDGHSVTMTSGKGDVSQFEEPVTFVGKRQRQLDGSVAVTLESPAPSSTKGSGLRTGLCYYKDEYRFIRVYLDVDSEEIVLELENQARSIKRRTTRSVGALGEGANPTFGLDHTELEFTFWYSVQVDGVERKEEIAKIDTLEMSGHDFVGAIIGLFAVSDTPVKVRYSDLIVEGI